VPTPIQRSSGQEIDKNRSWSNLALELFFYAAIFLSVDLTWDILERVQIFSFTRYWLPSVIVAFALLTVGLFFEYRAYRVRRKLTNLTSLRVAFIIATVSLFAFVQGHGH
jgi:hypothetical protein